MKVEQDISMVVWIGCLALLFLAVAVHEGWFASKAPAMITSGTESASNPSGPAGVGTSAGGGTVFDTGDMPWWYVPWIGG